jgi:hypothetical protein
MFFFSIIGRFLGQLFVFIRSSHYFVISTSTNKGFHIWFPTHAPNERRNIPASLDSYCTLCGYNETFQKYSFRDPTTHRVVENREVIFDMVPTHRLPRCLPLLLSKYSSNGSQHASMGHASSRHYTSSSRWFMSCFNGPFSFIIWCWSSLYFYEYSLKYFYNI